jgi:hypothetical protein
MGHSVISMPSVRIPHLISNPKIDFGQEGKLLFPIDTFPCAITAPCEKSTPKKKKGE